MIAIAPNNWRWRELEQHKSKLYAVCYLDANDPTNKLWMHRLIADAPTDAVVDHKDGDGPNNQRYNLRICTQQQNARNRRKIGGTSRFKGVSQNKGRKNWRAQIRDNNRTIYLGSYSSEEEAAKAYDSAAKERFGEYAGVNFPD